MIKGFDMSALARIDELGGKYYDNGIEENALSILKKYGANLIRLRIFNNPYTLDGNEYGAGVCDLKYLKYNIENCRNNNLDYLLDFHYSDCWADPGKQTMPKEWMNHTLEQLVEDVYSFTTKILNSLDYKPSIVQIGNEITNGMLWPIGKTDNFYNLVKLVNSGIKAVNDFDKNIKTMIHIDNGTNNELYHYWFDNYYKYGGIEFDYIGMSYYQIWNGKLENLINSIKDIIKTYNKNVIIAETSYPFSIEDYEEDIPDNERKKMALKPELLCNLEYTVSKQGQCDYFNDLCKCINKIDKLEGFIYWGSELIPNNGSGWATYEGIEYMHEKGPLGNEWANQAVFDYEGNSLPILDTIKNM